MLSGVPHLAFWTHLNFGLSGFSMPSSPSSIYNASLISSVFENKIFTSTVVRSLLLSGSGAVVSSFETTFLTIFLFAVCFLPGYLHTVTGFMLTSSSSSNTCVGLSSSSGVCSDDLMTLGIAFVMDAILTALQTQKKEVMVKKYDFHILHIAMLLEITTLSKDTK